MENQPGAIVSERVHCIAAMGMHGPGIGEEAMVN